MVTAQHEIETLEAVAFVTLERLTRDLIVAARTLSPNEVRYIIDAYYASQKQRIRTRNQMKAASEGTEPHELMVMINYQFDVAEKNCRRTLQAWLEHQPLAPWLLNIRGIGPVIGAGLLSHLELRPTVGAWWRFAGLDPTAEWKKGQKRPHNADLKRLCYLLGTSFVRQPEGFYRPLYDQRKEYEAARNAAGDYAEQAEAKLESFTRNTVSRAAYAEGRLPDGQIHMRAMRWTVKLFLSHLHEEWWKLEHGTPPPNPYVFDHLGHVHRIAPPPWP